MSYKESAQRETKQIEIEEHRLEVEKEAHSGDGELSLRRIKVEEGHVQIHQNKKS